MRVFFIIYIWNEWKEKISVERERERQERETYNSANYKTILPFAHSIVFFSLSSFYILIFVGLTVAVSVARHFITIFIFNTHTHNTVSHCIAFSFSLIYSSTLAEYARKCEYANWQYYALNADYVFIFNISFEHMLTSTGSKLLDLLARRKNKDV